MKISLAQLARRVSFWPMGNTIIDHELLLGGGRYRLLYTSVDGKVSPTELRDGGRFWFTPTGVFAQLLTQELHDMRVQREAREADMVAMGKQIDALLNHCKINECGECAKIICPHGDSMHFHHDGCPSCAQAAESVLAAATP